MGIKLAFIDRNSARSGFFPLGIELSAVAGQDMCRHTAGRARPTTTAS
jgi:hypothetical protein